MTVLFSERVKKLGLPADQFIVVASGVLDELGIRRAQDIDILATASLFDTLVSDPSWLEDKKHGRSRLSRADGSVELFKQWVAPPEGETVVYEDVLTEATWYNDVQFISLEFLRRWKQWSARDKDKKDVALIEAYQKKEGAQ